MRFSFRSKNALRSLTVVAAAGLTTIGLAACSGGGGAASAGSATSGSISWWGWTPTEAAQANQLIADFNKTYPNIKVTFKAVNISDWTSALRPALVSGKGPDVFEMQPGAYVQEFAPYAVDLTPTIKKALGPDYKSKVAPIGISGMTQDGKLTALSVGAVYAGTLWINQDLFAKYHLTPPTTLAQWESDCKTFKAAGVGCFAQGAAQEGFNQDTLQSIANSVDPGLWTKASKGTAKWDDPGIVQTLSIWKQLFTSGVMQPGALTAQQYPDVNNDFLTGKDAMVMMGTWYTQNATSATMASSIKAAGASGAKPFPAVPIPFPDVAGNGNTSELYGDADYGIAVYTKSQHQAAAETFAAWLATSKAGQQLVANQLDDIPALTGITPDFSQITLVDPSTQSQVVKSLMTKAATVTEPREALLSTDVQNAIQAAAQSVATGSASPQQAAETLQKAAVTAGETFK